MVVGRALRIDVTSFNVDEVLTLCQHITDQCAEGDDHAGDMAPPSVPLPDAQPVEREVGTKRVARRLGSARRKSGDQHTGPDDDDGENSDPPTPSDDGEDIGPVQFSDLTQLAGSKSDVGRQFLV